MVGVDRVTHRNPRGLLGCGGEGSQGADVSLRADRTYRVRIFQLDEHRQTVGEPELLGVYATEEAAKIAADAVLDNGGEQLDHTEHRYRPLVSS